MGKNKVFFLGRIIGVLLFILVPALLLSAISTYALPREKTDNQSCLPAEISAPKFLGIHSLEKMKPTGEFEIYLWLNKRWIKAGTLAYDRFLREREIDLSGLLKGRGKAKIKIIQKGGEAAHIDSIFLGGNSPQKVQGLTDELALHKLSKKDLDVADAYKKKIELTFPAQGDKKLKLTARIEGPIKTALPFHFPIENLRKETKDFSSFYVYELNPKNKPREPKLIFKEFSPAGSGHPSNFTYGWARNDHENLYVKIDFTPDNTYDGDKDYAQVFVKTPSGVKEFKVSTNETKWGKPYFTYTDKVPYQHKVYEFVLPLKEIGMDSAEKKDNILLAFSAYGTAAFSGNLEPSLAYDSQNNRYLLVYQKSEMGETPHIFGQLLNCDGTPFGEEFLISEGDLDKLSPSVAYDGTNQRFLVVWQELRSGTSYDIYGQLVNANGTLNGSNFVISDAEFYQYYPKVAYDNANQRFLVVWEDIRSNDTFDIYGQLVNADGTLNGSNFVISNAPNNQRNPSVAYDSVNQRFLVAWADTRGGISYDIYAQLVNANGTLSGSNFVISEATNAQYSPSVAYDGTNQRFLVVWYDLRSGTDYDIYGQLVSANGTLSGSNFAVSEAANDQNNPSVAFDSVNQRFLVVWEDARGATSDIYAQYVQADGTLSGSNFVISEADYDQLTPAVAYNYNFANFLVAYETRITGEINISDIGLNLVGPACTAYTLTVSKAGTGSGTVTSSPSGINCGTDCSEAYRVNASVTLTASASADSIFTGWSGDADCSDGQVTMDADKNCIANFNLISAVQEEIKIKGGGGCFIATAAFGSYLDPRVQVLRSFRDNYLLKNTLGQALVSYYYQVSPAIAAYIAKHESLRTATRWALTPIVYALQYPGIAFLLLLGLVVAPLAKRRLKKFLPVLILGSLLVAGPAMALQGHIFEPQVGEEKFVTMPSSSTIPQGKCRFGLFLDYADTPVETTTGIELSNRQFVGTFLAGVGITDALQISISVPYLFDQGGKKIDLASDIASWRFGDVNIAAKYRVLNEKKAGLGLALSPFVILNTGQENDWFGNNSFSGGLKLIVDKSFNNKTAIAFNLGYQIKKKEQLTSTQRIEDMILYGLGISHAFTSQLTLIGEIYGYTASSSAFEKYLSPLEGDISLAYKVCPWAQLVLGGGGAITKGVGAPEWRVLGGIRFGF